MTNLTIEQIELLRAAAAADDGAIDAPYDPKTVRSLIKRGLLVALPQADVPNRLIVTEAGRSAAADASPVPPVTVKLALKTEPKARAPAEPVPLTTPKGKLGTLVVLLRNPKGATVEAMSAATGWQIHSVRGAMSGGLKKNLGYNIASEKIDGARVYRIVA
jgi:hypothetical protein